jgi:RNA polymerase sigma-B factor
MSLTSGHVYPPLSGHTVCVRRSWNPEETAVTTRAELQDLSDNALLAEVRELPRDSELRAAICEILVDRYEKLVRSCVRQYRGSPEPTEDLMQVGYVGLLKAINNYNPEFGDSLSAYAQPCVSGEIKRHFRDKRWQVHVKRSVQELRHELRQARADLTQRLGRSPRPDELAAHLGVSDADLADAERADLAFQASSLDVPLLDGQDTATLGDFIGAEDPQLEHTLDIESVWAHMDDLPARQRRLLIMRFYGNMSQAEIGERLGISQMHVSRLLAGAIDYLRGCLLGPDAGPRH